MVEEKENEKMQKTQAENKDVQFSELTKLFGTAKQDKEEAETRGWTGRSSQRDVHCKQ